MSTWREHSFIIGKKYTVLKSFKTSTDYFFEGEIVTYRDTAYSRYDGSTVFIFEDAKGDICSWFLLDDEADNSAELFKLSGSGQP